MDLNGKRILITGGTAGIGLALARALGAQGAATMICGRDPARLDRAVAVLSGAEGMVCDVGQAETLPGLIDETVARLGGLDVLVNNAGIQLPWDLADESQPAAVVAARVVRELAIDLTAPMLLSQLALPHLRRGHEPAIVNVTSVLARQPRPASPVYCAAKAGLRSFTQSLRSQLEPHGIRVIELVPPLVETAMTRGRGQPTLPAADMARATLRGLQGNRSEIRVGKARAAVWIDRVAPTLLAHLMART